jgi:hypothetical protein
VTIANSQEAGTALILVPRLNSLLLEGMTVKEALDHPRISRGSRQRGVNNPMS